MKELALVLHGVVVIVMAKTGRQRVGIGQVAIDRSSALDDGSSISQQGLVEEAVGGGHVKVAENGMISAFQRRLGAWPPAGPQIQPIIFRTFPGTEPGALQSTLGHLEERFNVAED